MVALLLVFVIIAQGGCTFVNKQNDGLNGEDVKEKLTEKPDDLSDEQQKKMIDELYNMIKEGRQLTEVIEYIDNNIPLLSKDNASIMVSELEEMQKNYLPQIEEKFTREDMQQNMINENKSTSELNQIKDMKDGAAADLLKETRNSGFKVETAEGTFFPIVDYEFYKRYSVYVTDDMREYIDIMAVESGVVPLKDAALIISWEEVLKRALGQEKFLHQYTDSIKTNDIKELYKKYVTIVFYGANNTPLFNYDSKTLVPEAKQAYLNAIRTGSDSKLLKSISTFMDTLEENNDTLTNDVEQFRKKAVEDLTDKI